MADELAEFNQRFMVTLAEVLHEAGQAEVDHIKEDIGTEVEYSHGRVIRSLPGEPPRKETGKLQESIHYSVSQPDANTVELVISAGPAIGDDGRDYAIIMERGGQSKFGEIAAREYMRPSMERWNSNGEYIVQEGLKEAK